MAKENQKYRSLKICEEDGEMAYIYEEVRLIYDKDSGAGEGIKFLKYKLPWFNYHPILDDIESWR